MISGTIEHYTIWQYFLWLQDTVDWAVLNVSTNTV